MTDEELRRKKIALFESQEATVRALAEEGVNAAYDQKYPGRLELCVENTVVNKTALYILSTDGYSLHYAYHDEVDDASIVVFELEEWDGKEEYEAEGLSDEEWENGA